MKLIAQPQSYYPRSVLRTHKNRRSWHTCILEDSTSSFARLVEHLYQTLLSILHPTLLPSLKAKPCSCWEVHHLPTDSTDSDPTQMPQVNPIGVNKQRGPFLFASDEFTGGPMTQFQPMRCKDCLLRSSEIYFPASLFASGHCWA